MELRKLGSLQVAAIGLGTARTFDVTSARDIAVRRQIIDRCMAQRVTLVDSSPMYGQSEAVIGITTEGRRAHFQLATVVEILGALWTGGDPGVCLTPARPLTARGGERHAWARHSRRRRFADV